MPKFIAIQITTPDETTAERIGEYLVDQKLVACAQIEGPIKSIYKWESILEKEQEWRLILKTIQTNYKSIENKILEMHPYNVPQIVSFKIEDGFDKYLEWVESRNI